MANTSFVPLSDEHPDRIVLDLEHATITVVSRVGGQHNVIIIDGVETFTQAADALRKIAAGFEIAEQSLIRLVTHGPT